MPHSVVACVAYDALKLSILHYITCPGILTPSAIVHKLVLVLQVPASC